VIPKVAPAAPPLRDDHRRNGDADPELERAFVAARSYVPGSATAYLDAIVAHRGPFLGKPIGSCFSFVSGDARPSSATLHVPVAHYLPNDEVARDRVGRWLEDVGLGSETYRAALAAFARRPLSEGRGLQSYASVRFGGARPRLTVYLSAEAYEVMPVLPPGHAPAPPPRVDAEDIVSRYEARSVAEHPLFARWARERGDLGRVWTLLANALVGVSAPFPRRLSTVVARIPDDRARSVLAKQLNDELGNGDYTKSHRVMFETMVGMLEPHRPAPEPGVDPLAPGRQLAADLDAIYDDPDPFVGLGASIIIEVYGKQVDERIASELRRQKLLTPDAMPWFTLHEELEVAHVDEARELARLVPPGPAVESAWRGAEGVARAAWRFFDAMYRLWYAR
jgi:pyrroloquinoline quinone (PQQ) biosynthesis protein C